MKEAFKKHPHMLVLEQEKYAKYYDPCKVVFGIKGFSGVELDNLLKHPSVNIRTEVSNLNGVVAVIHPFMEEQDVSDIIERVTNLAD